MSDEKLENLLLTGYVVLASHGFALPCYSATPSSNAHYVANCTVDGDHNGEISEFEIFESYDIQRLPDNQVRRVAVGAKWVDVFLWNGRTYVGSPEEIWSALGRERQKVGRIAPLSLLDLALGRADQDVTKLVDAATNYLTKRYGSDRATHWRVETLARQQLLICVRRIASEADASERLSPYLADVNLRSADAKQITIFLADEIRGLLAREGKIDQLHQSVSQVADRMGFTAVVSESDGGSSQTPIRVEQQLNETRETIEPSLKDLDILIVVAGKRSQEIARHISPPDWTPHWAANGMRVPYRVRNRASDTEESPTISVVEDISSIPNLSRYGALVFLADDDILLGDAPSDAQDGFLQRLTPEVARVSLLAPGLPLDGPSEALTTDAGRTKLSNFGFDTLIDVSAARSPFWSGNSRRALDRRIADIVVAAAALCVGDSPLATRLTKHRIGGYGSLLTFGLHSGSRSRHRFYGDRLEMASESTWAHKRDPGSPVRAHEVFEFSAIASKGQQRDKVSYGTVELRERLPDFGDFAQAVVLESLSKGVADREIKYRRIPDEVLRTLHRRDLSSGFAIPGVLKGVAVLAEAPTIKCVRAGVSNGWAVVRYTDRDTLRDVFAEDVLRPVMPREVRLPRVHRLRTNRGLATRGIDPRDVIRLTKPDYENWRKTTKASSLLASVRHYKASLGADNEAISVPTPEFVLPWRDMESALEERDSGARRLLLRIERMGQRRNSSPKRPSDLRTAWTKPSRGTRRFVIADGVLPVLIGELTGAEVPSQRLFIVDGDAAVPTLFRSRLFRVWAQLTLSRSTSWMSRFSVTTTFETFPIPDPFYVKRLRDGRAELRFDHIPQKVASMTRRELVDLNVRRSSNAELPAELDQMVLSFIGLNFRSSDLEILERLLELNRTQAQDS